MKNILLSLALSSLVLSCGGSEKNNENVITKETTIIALDNDLAIEQAVELLLYAPDENVTDITWQQTAGPSVSFLTPHSKVIAFTPKSAGIYSFSITYQHNNNTKTLTKTITVADNTSVLSARLGHSVLEGNKVSLRAWLASNVDKNSVRWQQIAGPKVTLTDYNDGDLAIYFNAPAVEKDQVLQFTVQATDGNTTYSDTIAILIENAAKIPNNAYFTERVAKVFPYQTTSPYVNNLVACTYSNALTSSCKLSELPLIAQQTETPTVDDIMSRVVVSHHWMGERFKNFLENYDNNNDFKNLLRATTAIIIAYDVRPSFYWPATGAIYLDANNFWLTPEERDTINEAPDYRSEFGKELQFVMPWRYVKNNNYVSRYTAAEQRTSREPQDGLYSLTSLLFHELAHANDYFPYTKWQNYSSNTRILDAASSGTLPSDRLNSSYPLQSNEMRALAQVSFHGANANATQKAYSPSDISYFFSNDKASDYYNYSSLREDYAMLFDETMMYARYQIQRDVAITNNPQGENSNATDYIVDWGQRSRIGEETIKPRAKYVLSSVLPQLNAETVINNLPAPTLMRSGENWRDNLTLNGLKDPFTNLVKEPINNPQNSYKANTENRPVTTSGFYHKALPDH
jgi:hypothetical protein